MKRYLTVVTLIAIATVTTWADNAVERTAKGIGKSREDAVRKALYDAVSQVKGVDVSSGKLIYDFDSGLFGVTIDEAGHEVVFDKIGVKGQTTTALTSVGGLVKSYEVIDEGETEDGNYFVEMKVWVYDYIPPKTSRVRVAVVGLDSGQQSFTFGKLKENSEIVTNMLVGKLSEMLAGTNKFDMLDREYIAQVAKEQNILLSPAASMEERAKFGEVLGSDYILTGTLRRADIIVKSQMSPAIGKEISEYEGDLVFEFRLISPMTRQIKFVDRVVVSLENEEVKTLVREWEPQDLDYREMRDNFLDLAAGKVVEKIVDSLYPVKIALITESGQIVLDQGGRRISQGDIYKVYGRGTQINDQDTGESLGTVPQYMGTVKITEVTGPISLSKITDGNVDAFEEGMACRRVEVPVEKPVGAKSTIERNENRGVKMPFDK